MRTNVRKIISIFLAVLMVVGCMTTFATATSAAGENSVTFLDSEGNTIAAVAFDGTTTINALLEGGGAEAAKVNKAIKQTDTQVFIGWTSADGATPVDAAAEITESVTVKASFSAYKLYTWADLVAEKGEDRFKINSCAVLEQGTSLKVRLSSRSASFVLSGLDYAVDEYEVFVAKYSTNASNFADKNVPFVRVSNQTGTEVTSGYSGSSSTYITYTASPTNATADGTGVDEIKAVFPLYCVPESVTGISGIKLAPLAAAGSAQLGSAYPSTDGSYDFAKTWFDIQYFGFFEKEEAVEYFDYDTYLELPAVAVFKDTEGETIETLEADENGDVILPAYEEAVENGAFLGWKVEGADNSTAVASGVKVAIADVTVFVPVISQAVTIKVTDVEGIKNVSAFAGSKVPVEDIVFQYNDTEGTGEYVTISGWKVGETTYSIDDYVVNETDTELEAVYAPVYILSAADGTLESGDTRNDDTVNASVTVYLSAVLQVSREL